MKLAGKYIFLIFIVILTGILLHSCVGTTPKPIGKLDKNQVIEKYFKNRSLDEIEGVWIREDDSFEIAILKNSFKIFPDYEYIGVVTATNNRDWGIGETKLLIKKTSKKDGYIVSYFDDRAKTTKSQNEYDLIIVDDSIAKIGKMGHALIKEYPQDEAGCEIGFSPTLFLGVLSQYARDAGFITGDKLTAINGDQVLTDKDVSSKLNKKRAGDRIKIAMERNQQMVEVETVCKESPRKWFHEINLAEARGKWEDCISISYEAEQEYGPLSLLAGIRLHCAIENLSLFSRLGLNIAKLTYEHRRRMIVEASDSSQKLESIRSDVLSGISWLEQNEFASFANDLKKQWEEATNAQSSRSAPIQSESTSFGTGFVVSPDGLIMTAYHVVEKAKSIKVVVQDGRSFLASVHQYSKSNDVAVLRVGTITPNYLPLVPTRASKVGDPIFTMGFPMEQLLGKEPKFTDGTISALSGIRDEATFFQMSVPIQPGNSGGPVVNNRGEVIGVVTSTAAIRPFLSNTGTLPQNINWAVKSDFAIPLINESS